MRRTIAWVNYTVLFAGAHPQGVAVIDTHSSNWLGALSTFDEECFALPGSCKHKTHSRKKPTTVSRFDNSNSTPHAHYHLLRNFFCICLSLEAELCIVSAFHSNSQSQVNCLLPTLDYNRNILANR